MSSPTAARGCPFTDPQHLFEDLAATRAADGLPYAEALGARMVSRYDDLVAALHDPVTFSSAPTVPDMPSPWRERFERRGPAPGTPLGPGNPPPEPPGAAAHTFFMPRRPAPHQPGVPGPAPPPGDAL